MIERARTFGFRSRRPTTKSCVAAGPQSNSAARASRPGAPGRGDLREGQARRRHDEGHVGAPHELDATYRRASGRWRGLVYDASRPRGPRPAARGPVRWLRGSRNTTRPTEEQPRPAAGAAAALARRHDEHASVNHWYVPQRPFRAPNFRQPASVRARAGSVWGGKPAGRAPGGARPQAPSTRTPPRPRRPPRRRRGAPPRRRMKRSGRTVIRPERVGGVGVAPARRRRRLVIGRLMGARQQLFNRAAY